MHHHRRPDYWHDCIEYSVHPPVLALSKWRHLRSHDLAPGRLASYVSRLTSRHSRRDAASSAGYPPPDVQVVVDPRTRRAGRGVVADRASACGSLTPWVGPALGGLPRAMARARPGAAGGRRGRTDACLGRRRRRRATTSGSCCSSTVPTRLPQPRSRDTGARHRRKDARRTHKGRSPRLGGGGAEERDQRLRRRAHPRRRLDARARLLRRRCRGLRAPTRSRPGLSAEARASARR